MSKNWEEMGITWAAEEVSKQHGDHATDRRVMGTAYIPVVTDLGKFTESFGQACVLGILDGTSIRVMAQDVNRAGLAKNLKPDEIKDRIEARLRGVRNRPVGGTTIVKVKVHTLPNGTEYTGTDVVEYQQAYAAALIDQGVDATVAITIAQNQTL